MAITIDERVARKRLALMCAAGSDPLLDDDAMTELVSIAALPYNVPRTDLQWLQSDQLTNTTFADMLYIEVWLPDHQVYLAPDGLPQWEPGQTYAAGALVVPSVRNKFRYKVITGGTTGANEPVWPTAGNAGNLIDDGSVVWEPYGLSWMPRWDLYRAASEGWRWKAAIAASRFQAGEMGTSIAAQQVYEHCLAMSQEMAKKTVATVLIPPRHPRSIRDLETERESIYGWETEGRQWR